MNFRKTISEAELRRLYFDERLTQEEIAAQFGCSAITVKRRMVEVGIEIRARGPEPGSHRNFRYVNPEWTPALAYVIGVIATDGNLSTDGRHLSIKSKDRDLLETCKELLGLDNKIGIERKLLHKYYRLQWGDRAMYDWLVRIGLMPAKSLKLGVLDVPDFVFPDFLRGAIDGDGSINIYRDRWNVFKNPKYVYDRLFVELVSASKPFLDWIQATAARLLDVHGTIIKRKKQKLSHTQLWVVKYAKFESLEILPWIYHDADVPALERKRKEAMHALSMYD